MIKKIPITFFFTFLALSLLIFFRKNHVDVKNLSFENKKYISVSKFKFFQYKKETLLKFLEADEGYFETVDLLIFAGQVYGWRLVGDMTQSKESIQSGFVYSKLSAKQLDDLQKDVQVYGASFGNGAFLKKDDLVIYTQEAEYNGRDINVIQGSLPVTATNKLQNLDAKNGFKFDLNLEVIEIYGPVKGVVNVGNL